MQVASSRVQFEIGSGVGSLILGSTLLCILYALLRDMAMSRETDDTLDGADEDVDVNVYGEEVIRSVL